MQAKLLILVGGNFHTPHALSLYIFIHANFNKYSIKGNLLVYQFDLEKKLIEFLWELGIEIGFLMVFSWN